MAELFQTAMSGSKAVYTLPKIDLEESRDGSPLPPPHETVTSPVASPRTQAPTDTNNTDSIIVSPSTLASRRAFFENVFRKDSFATAASPSMPPKSPTTRNKPWSSPRRRSLGKSHATKKSGSPPNNSALKITTTSPRANSPAASVGDTTTKNTPETTIDKNGPVPLETIASSSFNSPKKNVKYFVETTKPVSSSCINSSGMDMVDSKQDEAQPEFSDLKEMWLQKAAKSKIVSPEKSFAAVDRNDINGSAEKGNQKVKLQVETQVQEEKKEETEDVDLPMPKVSSTLHSTVPTSTSQKKPMGYGVTPRSAMMTSDSPRFSNLQQLWNENSKGENLEGWKTPKQYSGNIDTVGLLRATPRHLTITSATSDKEAIDALSEVPKQEDEQPLAAIEKVAEVVPDEETNVKCSSKVVTQPMAHDDASSEDDESETSEEDALLDVVCNEVTETEHNTETAVESSPVKPPVGRTSKEIEPIVATAVEANVNEESKKFEDITESTFEETVLLADSMDRAEYLTKNLEEGTADIKDSKEIKEDEAKLLEDSVDRSLYVTKPVVPTSSPESSPLKEDNDMTDVKAINDNSMVTTKSSDEPIVDTEQAKVVVISPIVDESPHVAASPQTSPEKAESSQPENGEPQLADSVDESREGETDDECVFQDLCKKPHQPSPEAIKTSAASITSHALRSFEKYQAMMDITQQYRHAEVVSSPSSPVSEQIKKFEAFSRGEKIQATSSDMEEPSEDTKEEIKEPSLRRYSFYTAGNETLSLLERLSEPVETEAFEEVPVTPKKEPTTTCGYLPNTLSDGAGDDADEEDDEIVRVTKKASAAVRKAAAKLARGGSVSRAPDEIEKLPNAEAPPPEGASGADNPDSSILTDALTTAEMDTTFALDEDTYNYAMALVSLNTTESEPSPKSEEPLSISRSQSNQQPVDQAKCGDACVIM